MLVLIDNGHGVGTPGKQSPDGTIREYRYTRELARRLQTSPGATDSDRLAECLYDAAARRPPKGPPCAPTPPTATETRRPASRY